MKVPDTQENLQKCICMGCPTHNDCMKKRMQGMFCARGESDCELTQQGCICGECPLKSEYMLAGMYFCVNGAEA